LFVSEQFSFTHSRGDARAQNRNSNEEMENPNGGWPMSQSGASPPMCSDRSIWVRRYLCHRYKRIPPFGPAA